MGNSKQQKKMEQYIKFPALMDGVDLDDLLKRVLYPKIKGQRGGGFVCSDVERTQIDVLAGINEKEKKRRKPMKKLSQFKKFMFKSGKVKKQQPQKYALSPRDSNSRNRKDIEEEEE